MVTFIRQLCQVGHNKWEMVQVTNIPRRNLWNGHVEKMHKESLKQNCTWKSENLMWWSSWIKIACSLACTLHGLCPPACSELDFISETTNPF